jgi:hypothetical protein
MIVLVALLVLLVALPATIVLVALTIAGSAVSAVADGTLVTDGRAVPAFIPRLDRPA